MDEHSAIHRALPNIRQPSLPESKISGEIVDRERGPLGEVPALWHGPKCSFRRCKPFGKSSVLDVAHHALGGGVVHSSKLTAHYERRLGESGITSFCGKNVGKVKTACGYPDEHLAL